MIVNNVSRRLRRRDLPRRRGQRQHRQQHDRLQRQHRHRRGCIRRRLPPFAEAEGLCPRRRGRADPVVRAHGRGINAGVHSVGLQQAFDPAVAQTFANPVLYNNILWHNRSFYWDRAQNGGLGGLFPAVDNRPSASTGTGGLRRGRGGEAGSRTSASSTATAGADALNPARTRS